MSPDHKALIRRCIERVADAGKLPSFSQFGEDVFLYGYFAGQTFRKDGHALPLMRQRLPRGFYVDVGAYSPKQHSNTYLFYKLGWRGINIDATPGSMSAFDAIRPRDANIEAAVSDRDDTIDFYWWAKPGVVNTLSQERVQELTRELNREPHVTTIRARTLASLLEEHLVPGQSIDFMSVDVEGHDLAVLRSNDWARFRPRLVLVEHDVADARELTSLDITGFMQGVNYTLHSWLRPNLVFRDEDAERQDA